MYRLQKQIGRMFCILLLLFSLNINAYVVSAQEPENIAVNEIVFILDISGSMNDNDGGYLAPDSLKQFSESLPSGWQMGLVTYNEQVVQAVGLTDSLAIRSSLENTTYSGYTNTGVALNRAFEMFTENAHSKQIVLLTDGEISMPTEKQTQEAMEHLGFALQNAASKGISIHTIGLGDGLQNHENTVKRCAEVTGGRLIEVSAVSGLAKAVEQLMFETLDIKRIAVGTAQMSDNSGSYIMQVPYLSGAVQVKVYISSESPVTGMVVSCEGSEIQQIVSGKRFAVATIDHPASKDIAVSFTSSGASSAWMIVDCDMPKLMVTATYNDVKVPDKSLTVSSSTNSGGPEEVSYIYERTAQIKLELVDANGEKLLESQSFANVDYPVQINGEDLVLSVVDGCLTYTMPVLEARILAISVGLENVALNLDAEVVSGEVQLEAPPVIPKSPEPEPQMIPLWILFLTLAILVLVVFLLILVFRKKDKREKNASTQLFDSKFEFTGKLNIYVTKTFDDADIPPLVFDLFRLNRNREVSVKEITEKCNLPYDFPGTSQIMFVAGKNGSLQIVNDSDCTILIGRDILIKKRSHLMEYGEKIHITCDDDSEMELHYRSVKPSEKTAVSNASIRYFD